MPTPDIKDTAAPITCKNCGAFICNTSDSDVEMQLMINHLKDCKKNKSN